MLPDTIRVGPIDYLLREVSNLRDKKEPLFGAINPDGGLLEIHIEADMPFQRKQITLWHEVLHAIAEQAGRADEMSEGIATTVAHGVVAALRDNECLRGSE